MTRKATQSASRSRRILRGLEALIAVFLALGAAVLVVDLSDWKYARWDLTQSGHNTVDPELEAILDRLPQEARIDLFLRPLKAPFDVVHAQVAGRFLDDLQRIAGARRDAIRVVDYAAADLEESRQRQRELGIEGTNIIAVSCAGRHTSLRLYGDVASVDWGNPLVEQLRYLEGEHITGIYDPRTYRVGEFAPAQVSSVRTASALAEALLLVGSDERPRAVFVQGHGEDDPFASTGAGLSEFKTMLEAEGFETGPWEGARAGDGQGSLDESVSLVFLIGPKQSLPSEDIAALNAYVAAGGQLLVAPSVEEMDLKFERGAKEVLEDHGLKLQEGIVCLPLRTRGGALLEGTEEVTHFQVGETGLNSSHPTTTPLRADGRSVDFLLTPAFAGSDVQTVGNASASTRLTLIYAPKDAWLDLPLTEGPAAGRYDYRFENGRESRSRLSLVKIATYPLGSGGGRVLGIGSALFLQDDLFGSNRDFLRNAVNWLAHRETRLRIAPRSPLTSRLDLREGKALAVLNYTLWLGLPFSCGLIALFVAWRRRRA